MSTYGIFFAVVSFVVVALLFSLNDGADWNIAVACFALGGALGYWGARRDMARVAERRGRA